MTTGSIHGAEAPRPNRRGLVRLAPAERRWPFPWWATAIVAFWGGLVAAGLMIAQITESPLPACMFRRITGVPCGTCGSTRCVLAAGRGDIAEAFLHNPFMFTVLAGMAIVLGLRLIAGRTIELNLSRGGRRLMWIAIGGAFILNWAWVIWRETG